MKIIWATDGSAGSEAALPYLRGILNRRENQVVVATAAPAPLLSAARPDPSMLLWHLIPGYRDRVAKEVTELVVRQAGLLSKVRAEVTTTIRLGSAPSEIIQLAREEQADLILSGARGHTPAVELLLGSVSEQIAEHADCSVLVVRGSRRPARILVAFDGSDDAEAALAFLLGIAPPAGASVDVLSVIEPTMPIAWEGGAAPQTFEELGRVHRANARRHSQRAVRQLRASGWEAIPRLGEGHPGNVILKTARAISADLVVIGARGRHSEGDEDRGAGGIPRQVLERAPCSVLIARAKRTTVEA